MKPLLLLLALCPALFAASQPNVIVILADDLGWSDTSLYGTTTFYQTPNVERLAKRGILDLLAVVSFRLLPHTSSN